MNKEEIVEGMKKYYWYHCVDLGQGIVTDGDYELLPILDRYGFPEDMRGMSVLDVGRASGFFSFEFERRGAGVTATEIRSVLEWDFVGGEAERRRWAAMIGDENSFSEEHIYGAFSFARQVKGSKVNEKFINAYHIRPEAFEGKRFDLVFAGSITSHLRDPILALERLRSVTSGLCIVAAPSITIPEREDLPLMCLVGTLDSERRSWWMMNARCLVEMMRCAGFEDVGIFSQFTLENRRVKGLAVPHLVVHGRAS